MSYVVSILNTVQSKGCCFYTRQGVKQRCYEHGIRTREKHWWVPISVSWCTVCFTASVREWGALFSKKCQLSWELILHSNYQSLCMLHFPHSVESLILSTPIESEKHYRIFILGCLSDWGLDRYKLKEGERWGSAKHQLGSTRARGLQSEKKIFVFSSSGDTRSQKLEGKFPPSDIFWGRF